MIQRLRDTRDTRYTASTGMTWLLLGFLREHGVDVEALLGRVGVRLGTLMNPDERLPLSQVHHLWRAGEEAFGQDALGVRIIEGIDPRSTFSWPAPYSLHEHVGRVSATLRDAIMRQARLMRLMRDGLSVHVEGPHGAPRMRFECAVQNEPDTLVEFQMAAGLLLARRIADDPSVSPLEVRLPRAAPADSTPYASFFNAPVRFGADAFVIVCDGPSIDRSLPTANPMLLEVFERRARKVIDALPAIDDFVEIVRERIEAELPSGNTNASWVAETLGISPRTLHRRLQGEATSYQEVLDRVRSKLAMRLLASRKHAINEVAALVGFAQPSAFHRAFKGWNGETPAEYQERLSGAAASSGEPVVARAARAKAGTTLS